MFTTVCVWQAWMFTTVCVWQCLSVGAEGTATLSNGATPHSTSFFLASAHLCRVPNVTPLANSFTSLSLDPQLPY